MVEFTTIIDSRGKMHKNSIEKGNKLRKLAVKIKIDNYV
jgi:hypothetical protein